MDRARPVPEEAIRSLMAALESCFGAALPWAELVDLHVARREARRFKLDVSFALGPARLARFSVNDKGEPAAFRARVLAHADLLGLDPEALAGFFALSPPGEVQTTLGVKWRAGELRPDRTTLYLEELAPCRRGAEIRRDVILHVGGRAPDLLPGAQPNAVCIDWHAGQPVFAKCYDFMIDTAQSAPAPLPAGLGALRDGLPFHPVLGTRRYMLATRLHRGGALAGYKLLWMTEIQEARLAERAWTELGRLRAALSIDVDPFVEGALDELRRRFTDGDVFLFPDLIGLNVDPAGAVEGLLVHVSVR